MKSLKLFHFVLAKAPHFSVWGNKLDWEALLLGATHTSQQLAVEKREGKQHDPITPHAFMSHNNILYWSVLKENKHNWHIRFPVFNVISGVGVLLLLLITARINVNYKLTIASWQKYTLANLLVSYSHNIHSESRGAFKHWICRKVLRTLKKTKVLQTFRFILNFTSLQSKHSLCCISLHSVSFVPQEQLKSLKFFA